MASWELWRSAEWHTERVFVTNSRFVNGASNRGDPISSCQRWRNFFSQSAKVEDYVWWYWTLYERIVKLSFDVLHLCFLAKSTDYLVLSRQACISVVTQSKSDTLVWVFSTYNCRPKLRDFRLVKWGRDCWCFLCLEQATKEWKVNCIVVAFAVETELILFSELTDSFTADPLIAYTGTVGQGSNWLFEISEAWVSCGDLFYIAMDCHVWVEITSRKLNLCFWNEVESFLNWMMWHDQER